jgi:catechol 2,3-dioxygenase-like lactoylglutathione lyase family enzyme
MAPLDGLQPVATSSSTQATATMSLTIPRRYLGPTPVSSPRAVNLCGVSSSLVNHLRLTVSDIDASRAFYDPLMRCLGLRPEPRDDGGLAWGVPDRDGGMQWLILTPATVARPHDARAPGFHHVAFNARDRAQVDHAQEVLVGLGAEIIDPPAEYDDEPDHYAVFVRDPDGLKVEVVYVDRGGAPP